MNSFEITTQTLILVGVICVVLGFVANVLLSTLREDEGGSEASDDAPPGGRKGKYTPITRVWRDRTSGQLVVEMDGKAYVNMGPLSAEQRQRLESAVRDLRSWLGMGLAGLGQADPPVQTTPVSSPPSASVAPAETPAQADARQTAPNPVTAAAPVPAPQTVARSIESKPAGGKKTAPPGEEVSASKGSMVSQIEDILQDMTAGTSLAQRGIHLHEDPIRGVIVQVGSDYFEGIEAVTDPEAKAAIRNAVQRWEQGSL